MRAAARHARFAAWRTLAAARAGGQVDVDAPHAASWRRAPRLEIDSGARLVLRLGRGARLGEGTLLVAGPGGGSIALGDGVLLERGVRLEVRGGARIEVGRLCTLRDGVVLKASGGAALRLGEHVLVSYRSVLHCAERLEVGDHAVLAEHVTLVDSDHAVDGSPTPIEEQPLRTAPVALGRNVLVSAGAVVLRGAHVGDDAVIAARSVVGGGAHAAAHVHAGAPARAVRALAR